MPAIRIVRRFPLAPEVAWPRLTDWPRHGAHTPLTRTFVETEGATGLGTRFTARTGLGPFAFDDPMEVVGWLPPVDGCAGRCRLVKTGRVITGWAEIEVSPDGADGCEVNWWEELRVRGVPRLFDPVVAACARLVFGRTLAALLARA
ncbi:SRPBCC family protein [Streptomyces sp. NPDC006879]|uniref:SRPBCC family protein n=1 Tax=Streptomyces sp. NPDC006879 TaxID=3364767 RepID=UPI0036768529